MAEFYTTRQTIALVKLWEIYTNLFWDELNQGFMKNGDANGLPMSFEHWLLRHEAEGIPKPDCRNNGNSGRKEGRKLDRVKSIDKIYFNIKGEQIKITKYLPGVSRFKDDKGRMYTPNGYANIGAMRLPKEYNLIIN